MYRLVLILLILVPSAVALTGVRVIIPDAGQFESVCACSRQADSLYLINTFFPTTNGPSWTVDIPGGETPWNVGAPLDQWVGVVLNAQGCVREINLEMRDLAGAIPGDIGQLCGLEKLILSNNALGGNIPPSVGDLALLEQLWLINTGLIGAIPAEIGNLDNLFDLRLSDNQLSGDIPVELANCDGLFRLWLDDNQLTGEIPEGLGNLPFLSIFFVDGNQLSGCVPESFAGLSTLNQFEFFGNDIECLPDLSATGLSCNRLRGQNNRLTFDDILPNVNDFCTDIFYSPQDSIGQNVVIAVPAGTNYAIDLGIDQTVPDNQYRWFRNGLFYPPLLNSNQLVFNDIGFADAGDYRSEVTNPGAPALTLYSRTVTLDVFCATEIVQLDTFLCPGEVVQINGDFYGTGFPLTGSYLFPGGNRHGCDSLLNIEVFFFEESVLEIQQGICPEDTIVINDVSYHAGNLSGIETLPGGASTGCDSFIIVDLTILQTTRDTFTATICEGDSVLFGETYLTESGLFADTFVAANGCDSISNIDLIVHPTFLTTLMPEVCEGDTFFLAGKAYTSQGIYTDTLITNQGCDSIVLIDLTVNPVYYSLFSDTICASDSLLFQGQWYNQTGSYFDTLSSAFGCDSILGLELVVLADFQNAVDTSVCSSETLLIGDSLITLSGTYIESLIADNGCDSNVVWHVSILEIFSEFRDTAICSGDLLVLGGQTILETGTYPFLYTAANGCDSLVEWHVEIRDTAFTDVQADICEGFSYQFGGQMLSTAGVYRDTLQTVYGCDSIIQLDLEVLPILQENLSAEICDGDSLFFGGEWRTAPGEYFDSLQTLNGCDSVVILFLSVNASPVSVVFDTICAGSSLLFGTDVLSLPGTYADTALTPAGCDSVTVLKLTVLPVPQITLEESVCQGEVVSFGSRTLDSSGIYIDTLIATNGCDSIVTLDLEVRPVYFTPLQASICEGDSIGFGNRILTEQGIYLDTLVSLNGCDSILQLEVFVLPIFQTPLTASICEGDSLLFGNNFLFASGLYDDTLTAANGCDSIVTLMLDVLPVFTTVLDTSICQGESFGFGGVNLVDSGEYRDTLTATNGCDSVVILNLAIRQVPFVAVTAEICEGEKYLFGGSLLDSTGVYEKTFVGANGCDSIVELTLNVFGPGQLGFADAGSGGTVCGPSAALNAISPGAGVTGRWMLLSGAGMPAPANEASTLVNGLSAGENSFAWILSSVLCADYDADTVVIFREGTPTAADDQAFRPYTADSIIVPVIDNDLFENVTDFDVLAGSSPLLGQITFLSDATIEYRGPDVEATDEFSYLLCNAVCPDLCDTGIVTIFLEESPLPDAPDIPNAFSPNGDGVNDLWVIGDLDRLSVAYPENELVIFNRWGDVVYEASPYRNDWNGQDQSTGKILAEGTYWYVFRLSLGDRKVYKGDITILR